MRPVTAANTRGCAWWRNASVLLWTPVLLLGPVLSLGDAAHPVVEGALVVVMAGAAAVAVLTSSAGSGRLTPLIALTAVGATAFAGAGYGSEWLPTWILVALTVPSVLRGWWLVGVLPVVVAASMWAASTVEPASADRIWTEGFVVLLAGLANTAVVRLIETIEVLRRTREELVRRAVADERERFSRDLHDLLGHTLSVMVVKAEAVRRLVPHDPAAAAEHAGDIERIGREALVDVRRAVDGTRVSSLTDELQGARMALDAAGIRAEITTYAGAIPQQVDETLAWVVREAVTNVLRHSGAARCRLDLADGDDQIVLTVADDGAGAPVAPRNREGGLDGLRRRLVVAGGRLDVEPNADGFRLTACIPRRAAAR